MTYQQLLDAYKQQGGQVGTDVQNQAFNQWTTTLPGGKDGNWDNITSATPQPSINRNEGAAGSSTSAGNNLDLGALVPSAPPSAPVVPQITPVPAGAGAQGYSQNEAGGQSGGYTSVGANSSTQTGQQTQNSTEAGSQTGSQSGQTSQTTQVNDPFNLTSLVGKQLGDTSASDSANRAWLGDFRDTGGTAFGGQVDQAIRNSLTGPQMTGAGDSARARAAGYGAAEVARGNAGQRLQAAQQLNSPTALTQSVGQVSPLLGSTTSGTSGSTTSAINNLTKQASTLDLQSLVGNEAQAGTATGQSASQGSGVAPAGQTVKSGGCVVCTAYVSRGEMKPGAVRRACKFKQANWSRYGTSLTGYLFYGPLLARLVLSSDLFARLFYPIARAVLYEEVRLSRPTRLRKKWNAYITHGVFDLLSWPVGFGMKVLGIEPDVRDLKIKAMLVRLNLNFSL